jgi:hypothetical protein
MGKFLKTIVKQDLDIDRIRLFTADGYGYERQPLCTNSLNRTICFRNK